MCQPVGPRREQVKPDSGVTADDFAAAVGVLCEGSLFFEPPFDTASAAALAGNPGGPGAVDLFHHARARLRPRYRIVVNEIVGDPHGQVEREVANCVLGAAGAAGLLADLSHALDPHHNGSE